MNKLEEMEKAIIETDNRELVNFITESHTELVVNVVNNIIPELVFKEYFLEFFFNLTKGVNESTIYFKWVELAGSAYREVDVVDNNGEILYTVPAIFSRPTVNTDITENIDFDKIINTFNLKQARFETEGNNYLVNQLSGLEDSIVCENKDSDTARWRNIFSRYGLLDETNKKIPDAAKKTIETNESDIYDFD